MNKTINAKSNKLFDLHPSLKNEPRPLLERAKYVRNVVSKGYSGEIQQGHMIGEFITVHWDNQNCITTFTETDENWIFNFEKLPGEYLSFSWSLLQDDVEAFKRTNTAMIRISNIENKAGKDIEPQILGRMTVARDKRKETIQRTGRYPDETHQIAFSFTEFQLSIEDAYECWMDFIIIHPKKKTLVITKPKFWLQKRLIF